MKYLNKLRRLLFKGFSRLWQQFALLCCFCNRLLFLAFKANLFPNLNSVYLKF
jgi:hypothetical protein